MFSRTLVKLIDEAIVPAVVLVAAKVVGTLFVASYFGIPATSESTFFSLYFSNREDFLLVNSYSNLLMCLAIALGGLFFLVRSRFFHDSHITPTFAAKIFSLRIGNMVKTSFDVYSQGTIWLSYSYLLTILTATQMYFNLVFTSVFIVSLVLSVLLTLVLVSDIDRELER